MTTYCNSVGKCVLDDLGNKLKRKSNIKYRSMRSDDDKRVRREIANNNERRRMKSINKGFENLRKLLPYYNDCEKLSKAAILQSTAKYIGTLKDKIGILENELKNVKDLQESCDLDKSSNKNLYLTKNPVQAVREKSLYSSVESTSELDSSISSSINESLNVPVASPKTNEVTLNYNLSTFNSQLPQQQMKNLEQLLAAAEQVERLDEARRHMDDTDKQNPCTASTSQLNEIENYYHTNTKMLVMKPTISPFTEEIINTTSIRNYQTTVIETNPLFLSLSCRDDMNLPEFVSSITSQSNSAKPNLLSAATLAIPHNYESEILFSPF